MFIPCSEKPCVDLWSILNKSDNNIFQVCVHSGLAELLGAPVMH